MGKPLPEILREAHESFATKAAWLRGRRGLSQAAAEREMKKRGAGKAQKTVSNVENTQHDSRLSSYKAVAELYGVPLWVMMNPDVPFDMLEGERLQRFKELVDNYLHCKDDGLRQQIENVARAYAGMAGPSR